MFWNWLRNKLIFKAKSRLHRVCDQLYMLRRLGLVSEHKINKLLDEDIYPILVKLDELRD